MTTKKPKKELYEAFSEKYPKYVKYWACSRRRTTLPGDMGKCDKGEFDRVRGTHAGKARQHQREDLLRHGEISVEPVQRHRGAFQRVRSDFKPQERRFAANMACRQGDNETDGIRVQKRP